MSKLSIRLSGTAPPSLEVIDETGEVRADVYIDIFDGRVQVAIADRIVERGSDVPDRTIPLLDDQVIAPEFGGFATPVWVVMRNEVESGRRCYAGVFRSADAAKQGVKDDMEEYYSEVYDEANYDIIESILK